MAWVLSKIMPNWPCMNFPSLWHESYQESCLTDLTWSFQLSGMSLIKDHVRLNLYKVSCHTVQDTSKTLQDIFDRAWCNAVTQTKKRDLWAYHVKVGHKCVCVWMSILCANIHIGVTHRHLSDHLSELVEHTLTDLEQSKVNWR